MHFIDVYILIWVSAVLSAIGIVLYDRSVLLSYRNVCALYAQIIWKVVTFAIATTLLSIIAPIANDPTWDIAETIIMCTLTFFTAPWAVGVIYRAIIGFERNGKEIYIATIFWLFSASWSYDLYVWIWQGTYPISWFGNLMISSILYLCAGMFWSLEWREQQGMVFSFREQQWILNTLPKGQFRELFPYMIPFALLGMVIFGGFLYVNM